MKRSNLILGGTAFLLTVAGVIASKASKAPHHTTGYTKVTNPCHSIGQVTATLNTTPAILDDASGNTVFTSACGVKLHTVAD